MNSSQLTQSLKAEAQQLGFQMACACPAVSPTGFSQFEEWLDAGYAGEMHYLEERKEAYEHPNSVLENVQSILMLGMNYQTAKPTAVNPGQGRVARYAWGEADYHDVIHTKLKSLKRFANGLAPEANVRGVVDTAPLLEREFAELAGMGWRAKNTLLINKEHGSWFFLAALLLDVALEADEPATYNHCGTCQACLDACPTNAFAGPNLLDATKCISYLTIEHRSPIPLELRPNMGDWILGCDVCQDVCPWNRKASFSEQPEYAPAPNHNPIDLRKLFALDDDAFRARFRKTPLWRPKRRGILRNAAIVLGNQPHVDNLAPLGRGINDEEPLIRGASAWALGQHKFDVVNQLLVERLKVERDKTVQAEIELALRG